MVPAWLQAVGYILTAVISAGLAALLSVRATNRKTISESHKADQEADKADAEARRVISDAARELIEPLTKRAQDLDHRLRSAEQELLEARRLTETLTDSLREAQAETASLRVQVDEMSKELTALHSENERLRS